MSAPDAQWPSPLAICFADFQPNETTSSSIGPLLATAAAPS